MDSTSPIFIVFLTLSAVSSIFLGLLTFLILQFTAKPKLRVTVSSPGRDELEFDHGQTYTLRFDLENVGHWYRARPAASNITLWVNFVPALEPLEIRYGANLQISNRNVQPGAGGGQYMEATGIYLFYEEPGEAVEVKVRMPAHEGTFRFWVAAYANEGGCGVHNFQLTVI